MSFILDALKKSEAERMRRDTPRFADVADRKEIKPTVPWMWIVAALVLVNVGVLAVLFLKPGDSSAPVAKAGPGAAVDPPPTTQAAVAPSVVEAPASQAGPSTRRISAIETEPVNATPMAVESPAVEAASEFPAVTPAFATFNDLRAQGVLNLPDLHLDIHVYSNEPDDRFVFVNMSKYKERATLDEGPFIREITPEGVILEFRGAAFLLPRE
ncbi:MAG: general secretion pathway protein GspB [Woeseiaceae bacterium]|nr:general secretion pathway protein GspB [Woeseiaceae bacterium]